MELLILILVVVVLLALLARGGVSLVGLAVNTLVGVVLLILTNLFLSPPIPINLITLLICAIGGVVGWLVILVLHLLGMAILDLAKPRGVDRLYSPSCREWVLLETRASSTLTIS